MWHDTIAEGIAQQRAATGYRDWVLLVSPFVLHRLSHEAVLRGDLVQAGGVVSQIYGCEVIVVPGREHYGYTLCDWRLVPRADYLERHATMALPNNRTIVDMGREGARHREIFDFAQGSSPWQGVLADVRRLQAHYDNARLWFSTQPIDNPGFVQGVSFWCSDPPPEVDYATVLAEDATFTEALAVLEAAKARRGAR